MSARQLALNFAMLFVAALATACSAKPAAPLTVSDVRLFAPLTGSQPAVGYFVLHNQSNMPITIERISSSDFGDIQMHETVIRDGVARMQALPTAIIDAGSSLEFVAGGKHLMLLQPAAETVAGSTVMLEFHYDSGGILVVSVAMQARMPAE